MRNNGSGTSEATTLHYYRSIDATITTSDTEEDSDAVAELDASESTSESVDLTAPSDPEPTTTEACADAVTDESDTTNNCSSSVQVDVQGYPDLAVGSPSVNNNSPDAGASFTLTATVRNSGDGEAPATTLRYYRSDDTTITTSDTEVGTVAVGTLSATGTSPQSISLAAPTTAGAYYYGACVDTVAGESVTTNNCSASVKVDVEEPKFPDLEVGTPTVNETSPQTGATFTLSVTVSNTGDAESATTTLRYYQSTDVTISTSDTEVGTDAVGTLLTSGTSPQSISLAAPATAGAYYYGACVDTVTDESDTTDNCSSSVKIDVQAQQPSGTTTVEITAPQEWAPVGGTEAYSARVLNSEGEEMSGYTFSWTSSDTSKATVDSSGVVTAVAVGEATITATASTTSSDTANSRFRARGFGAAVSKSQSTLRGSLKMNVVKRASRIVVSPDSLSFDEAGEDWVGSLKSLTATAYDSDNNEMQPEYWSWSSSDEDVVTVRPFRAGTALVQSIWIGNATVTVTANDSAMLTVSITVTVTLPAGRVQLEPRSLTFDALGDTQTVTVRIFDENGEEDEDATWNYTTFSRRRPAVASAPEG